MDTQPVITKQQALDAYDGSVTALALALGITKGAVSQWPDGPIPDKQALKLCYVIAPDKFQAA